MQHLLTMDSSLTCDLEVKIPLSGRKSPDMSLWNNVDPSANSPQPGNDTQQDKQTRRPNIDRYYVQWTVCIAISQVTLGKSLQETSHKLSLGPGNSAPQNVQLIIRSIYTYLCGIYESQKACLKVSRIFTFGVVAKMLVQFVLLWRQLGFTWAFPLFSLPTSMVSFWMDHDDGGVSIKTLVSLFSRGSSNWSSPKAESHSDANIAGRDIYTFCTAIEVTNYDFSRPEWLDDVTISVIAALEPQSERLTVRNDFDIPKTSSYRRRVNWCTTPLDPLQFVGRCLRTSVCTRMKLYSLSSTASYLPVSLHRPTLTSTSEPHLPYYTVAIASLPLTTEYRQASNSNTTWCSTLGFKGSMWPPLCWDPPSTHSELEQRHRQKKAGWTAHTSPPSTRIFELIAVEHDFSDTPPKTSTVKSWSDLDIAEAEFRRKVEGIICQPTTKPWANVDTMSTKLYQPVMDALQAALDDTLATESGFARKAAIKTLQAISRISGHLPNQLALHDARLQNKTFVTGGGFSDIYVGNYQSHKVCLKVLRLHASDRDVAQSFRQEVLLWRQLRHPRILPLLGIGVDISPSFGMISTWMDNGSINKFLQLNPNCDRPKMLLEIIEGIEYLHTHDPVIVHADIRGANILVQDDLTCCLADFGLTMALETRSPTESRLGKGATHWMPPEAWQYRLDASIPARDIYSFGCTVIEIYSGMPPFPDIKRDAAVLYEVVYLKRKPTRPKEITETALWDIVEACLEYKAEGRPLACEVYGMLKALGSPVQF